MDRSFLKELGLNEQNDGTSTGLKSSNSGKYIESYSPVDGTFIGSVSESTAEEYEATLKTAEAAFKVWKKVPAPQRGEIVRQYGEALRKHKDALGRLVSYEMGKSLQEGWGEVQEMIDICDFAVGQSRQLYGLSMHSERPEHRMSEQWHPLGIVGVISSFNFPVAVWAWNTMIALIAGDVVVWKPSSKTPVSAVACMNLFKDILKQNDIPEGVVGLVCSRQAGKSMVDDKRIPLISATGSTYMGQLIAPKIAQRFGRTILELGGNNAVIITPNANMELVLPSVVFGAVGTAGQRCTSTRRIIVHEDIYDEVKEKLANAYAQLRIGDPLDMNNHVGPVIDQTAVDDFLHAIKEVKTEGGSFIVEGEVLSGEGYESGFYVKPCIAEVKNEWKIVQSETFAPILYMIKYKDLDEAIHMQNDVPQGLSSAILTDSVREAEQFLCASGSDCGIANVNIGTSGAEIGGAFGGEKETGGGRESGSDAWKVYMRRQTNTVNYSTSIPLAQGIKFEL
jgi:aldehyde dehydrogenase (NAD+)